MAMGPGMVGIRVGLFDDRRFQACLQLSHVAWDNVAWFR